MIARPEQHTEARDSDRPAQKPAAKGADPIADNRSSNHLGESPEQRQTKPAPLPAMPSTPELSPMAPPPTAALESESQRSSNETATESRNSRAESMPASGASEKLAVSSAPADHLDAVKEKVTPSTTEQTPSPDQSSRERVGEEQITHRNGS